ncbi:MAG: anaerobic sulfatase maturase [Anaerolineae bacterium]
MPFRPAARPASAPPYFHVLTKPTGAICNLDCKYCFFLSKESLYPGSRFRMSDEVLETYIRQMIEAQSGPQVSLAFQGGEPTLMGLDFFRRAVALAQKYAPAGTRIEYALQTNGTLLDEAWCDFFREHNFLIGLSLDGPRPMHDAYRVDKGGAPTFDRVLRAARLMQERQVEFNILCTVHAANAPHPLEVYRFFRDEVGAQFIQFIPIVERATAETLPLANRGWGNRRDAGRPLYTQSGHLVTARSVTPEGWGRFLITIFDEWVRRDVGTIFVQMFDAALASWVGAAPALCVFAETCGNALALEHNGDLYACDHYVEPDYLLGNITETHMIELVASDKQRTFGTDKRDTLPRYCRECPVRFACHGECPRNRFITTPDGEPGLNYLCAGYKAFFTHVDRPMRIMADLLRRGRAPAEIMAILAASEAQLRAAFAKAGRNDPCPCGSGKKFKLCHGRPQT